MAVDQRFTKLFEPIRIGEMTVRNRIVMPPMGAFLKAEGRYGVDKQKDYYGARAKGGAGLVIVEATAVDYQRARYKHEQLSADDDKYVPGLSEIAEAIHHHGARAAVQLHHPGSVAKSAVTGCQPVGPSAVAKPGYETPRALSVAEIQEVITLFARAAERLKRAGFDGVEISAGHRYIIDQFLSTAWNKREDDYGGSFENRARFLLEIINETRRLVGDSYPLWCRLNGIEYGVEEGITLEEALQVAVMVEKAGTNAVHVSGFPPLMPYHAEDIIAAKMPLYGPGYFADLAQAIKKVVKVPVIAVGRLDPLLGERLLRENKADLIAMGRRLIADPELPNKVASGRLEDIAPCVYCNNCMAPDLPRECTVNAARGREREYELKPAEKPKKVVVIGGGPAGMEAARVAALRGHKVTLYEKDHRLGGQLILAGLVREEYESLTRYLTGQVSKLGVKVEVGKAVGPAMIESSTPDAVIVATGPAPSAPDIPGIGGDNVISAAGLRSVASSSRGPAAWLRPARWRRAMWYLGFASLRRPLLAPLARRLVKLGMPFGRRVVVVGGGLPGLELAEFLVKQGKKVTIVETRDSVAGGLKPMYLLSQFLFHELAAKGVSMLAGAKYEQVVAKGLVITTKEGQRQLIESDTIVIAGGAKADIGLARALEGKVPQVFTAGDSVEPCGICEAIAAGSRSGRAV